MEKVYLETTFISYLVATPKADAIIAGKIAATTKWWDTRRQSFNCYVSDEVRQEASKGDCVESKKRLNILAAIQNLNFSSEAANLSINFLRTGVLPPQARSDAVHLAIATSHKCDYLLTWNCKHLANAQIVRRLQKQAAVMGWRLPIVCTPLELMEIF